MKADSSPKKHALTSSSVSLVPPNFVLRGGRSLVSSYSSFFSQTLNGNTNQAYANGVKLFCDFLTSLNLEDAQKQLAFIETLEITHSGQRVLQPTSMQAAH